jgi:hypothetical protein
MRSIKSKGFDQRWCAGAAKVKSLPWIILSKAGRVAQQLAVKEETKKAIGVKTGKSE